MKNFLEKYNFYMENKPLTAFNVELIFYATKLRDKGKLTDDLLDEYDRMNEMLDWEIEQLEFANPMFDNDNEHRLCCNELL